MNTDNDIRGGITDEILAAFAEIDLTFHAPHITAHHKASAPSKIWRPHPHRNVEVSDRGDIRCRETKKIFRQVRQKGTLVIRLREAKAQNWSTIAVARLVCEAWHGVCPDKNTECLFKDGDCWNVSPSNLAWKVKQPRSTKNLRSPEPTSLADQVVQAISLAIGQGQTSTNACREHGTTTHIYKRNIARLRGQNGK